MQEEAHDPETGEIIIENPPQRAADGRPIPAAARTLGQFIDQLEDGQFSVDANEELRKLADAMDEIGAISNGAKVPGRATIQIDFVREGSAFKIVPSIKIKTPEMRRPPSIAWRNDEGLFTRFPSNQGQFFGVRDASGPSKAIRSL